MRQSGLWREFERSRGLRLAFFGLLEKERTKFSAIGLKAALRNILSILPVQGHALWSGDEAHRPQQASVVACGTHRLTIDVGDDDAASVVALQRRDELAQRGDEDGVIGFLAVTFLAARFLLALFFSAITHLIVVFLAACPAIVHEDKQMPLRRVEHRPALHYGDGAAFTARWFGAARQGDLRPWDDSTGEARRVERD